MSLRIFATATLAVSLSLSVFGTRLASAQDKNGIPYPNGHLSVGKDAQGKKDVVWLSLDQRGFATTPDLSAKGEEKSEQVNGAKDLYRVANEPFASMLLAHRKDARLFTVEASTQENTGDFNTMTVYAVGAQLKKDVTVTAAPSGTAVPFETVLSGPNGPSFKTKLMIDTDTGWAGSIGMLYLTDGDAVQALPQDKQEMDDNKYYAVEITLGPQTAASSVQVTDVRSDGKQVTVSYTITPAAAGAAQTSPFCLVRYARQDGIPGGFKGVVLKDVSAGLPSTTLKKGSNVVVTGVDGDSFTIQANGVSGTAKQSDVKLGSHESFLHKVADGLTWLGKGVVHQISENVIDKPEDFTEKQLASAKKLIDEAGKTLDDKVADPVEKFFQTGLTAAKKGLDNAEDTTEVVIGMADLIQPNKELLQKLEVIRDQLAKDIAAHPDQKDALVAKAKNDFAVALAAEQAKEAAIQTQKANAAIDKTAGTR